MSNIGIAKNPKKLHQAIRATIVAAAVTTGAQAVANESTGFTLEEVIVTAQKRAESLQDVPISVSAMSGEKMEASGVQRFEDVSAYIPNFTVVRGAVGDKINIRGIQTGAQAGFEQSVGTFVDGVYRGRAIQSRFSFLDMGMVEVLRGPQGTLFGKNTVAGAMNIRTAKPTDEFEGKLRVGHNIDLDETEITAHASGAISDQLRGRVAILNREMDKGWIDNEYYDESGPQTDEQAGRISLEWDASPNTLVSFKYERGEWDNSGEPYEVIAATDELKALGVDTNLDGKSNMGNGVLLDASTDPVLDFGSNYAFEGDLDEYSLSVEHDLDSGLTLTSIVGYSKYDYERKTDADFTRLHVVRFDDNEEFEQKSFELRLASDTGGAVEYITGLYYQDADLFTDGLAQASVAGLYPLIAGACANPATPATPAAAQANACGQQALIDPLTANGSDFSALPGVARYTYMDQNTEAWAMFGQVTWKIQDDLRATLGLRYTEEEKTATQSAQGVAYLDENRSITASGVEAAAGQLLLEFIPHTFDDLQRDEESFTWSLNIQKDVNEDTMVYASASTGFKAGGFNSFTMGDDPADSEFEEEEVLSFELGSKMSLLEGAAELNVAAFYTQYDNLQASVFSGQTTFDVKNAAEATTQGIEIDGRWQATENLLLSGSFGWVDFEFDSFVNQACTNAQFQQFREEHFAATGQMATNATCAEAGVNDLTGRTAAQTPEFAATVSANYTQPLDTFTLRYNVDVIYQDEVYRQDDLDELLLSDASTKINASIHLTPESDVWEVSLLVKNLTDEDDEIYYGNDTPLLDGGVFASISAPRTVTLVGTLHF